MAVYDDEQQKTGVSDDELRRISGVSPDEEGAMEREAYNGAADDMASSKSLTPEELAEAEASGGEAAGSTAADESEASSLSDDADDEHEIPYRDEKTSKARAWFSRRRNKIGLGIATAGVAGTMGIASFFGPVLFVNHLRELLLTRVSQMQTDHSLRYRRKYIHKVGDMFTRDGRRGGKIIADMESRGYRFSFDNTGKMVGLTLPDGTTSLPSYAIADHLNEYIEVRHPLRTSRWKTKRMEAFYGRYKVTRRPVTVRAPDDPEDPERAVNKKMFEDITGDDTRIVTTGRVDGEDDPDAEQRNVDNEAVANNDGLYDDIKAKLREGTPIEELSADEQKLLRIGMEVDDELFELVERIASSQSVFGKAFNSVKSLFNIADIGDKVCTVQNRMAAVQVAARTFRAVGMLRYTSSFIKVADATRADTPSSRVDPSMLNALMKRVTATDRNGNALGASPGMAYILKGKFSKTRNDSFKGDFGIDGKLEGFPKVVKDSTDNLIPGDKRQTCGVIQSPITQIGLAVVQLGAAFFTGGTSTAASEGAKQAALAAFKTGLRNLFTRQTAIQLGKAVAIELSFEGIMTLTQLYAERSMSVSFTGQEKGGELGNIIGGGAGTLNKQRSFQAGMVPATAEQYRTAYAEFLHEKDIERQNQSMYARYLDYSNPDSLAFQTVTAMTVSPEFHSPATAVNTGMHNIASTIAKSPFNLLANVFSPFTSSVDAQSADEIDFDTTQVGGDTLATDPAGNFLPIMRADIEAIDPEENVRYLISTEDIDPNSLEPLSENYKKHIEYCVENTDTYTPLEQDDSSSNPQHDCLAKMDITKRYKAHLAYLDMMDGIDATLFPEDIGASPLPQTSTGATGAVVGNTSDTPCAAGTIDAGVTDGYSGGQRYTIRLCEIPNFRSNSSEDINGLARVNSTGSAQWFQLFQRSLGSGITLSANSSFRTMERQEYLYNCMVTGGCNNGNTAARPGYSNHQIGLAIDIDIAPGRDPSLTTCQANPDSYPVYKWLAANGPPLGIEAKVSSECWHWSVGGS